jgi:hypothetical protein
MSAATGPHAGGVLRGRYGLPAGRSSAAMTHPPRPLFSGLRSQAGPLLTPLRGPR